MDQEQNRGGILVVEDNVSSLRLLSRILTKAGYTVQSATSGREALDMTQTTVPDLVLLDILMEGMDGIEVCLHLKADERTRDVPVLFISALSGVEDKVKAFDCGGVDYVTKPFRAKEVLARVATHLGLRDLQAQLQVANQELEQRNVELQQRNAELQEALRTIKTLSGLIPICAWCGRKIEDEEGQWVPVETFIETHSEATFTHGMCPDCRGKMEAQAARVRRQRSR